MPHGHEDDEHEHEEGRPDVRPFLCLPYWTAPLVPGGRWDTGEVRPIPSAVVSWLSPAIAAGAYRPGEPLDVVVSVRNSGDGNSPTVATVAVYWADPTVGFAKPTFFGATTVSVPPSRTSPVTVRTATLTARIPASAPDHICLLAVVHHPQDPAGSVCDPVSDRHWAQRNLTAVAAQPGAPAMIAFDLVNPTPDAGEFALFVRQVDFEVAQAVARTLELAGVSDTRPLMTLHDRDGRAMSEPLSELVHFVGLDGWGGMRVQLSIEPEAELSAGDAIVVEALMTAPDERPVGSLGFVVNGG